MYLVKVKLSILPEPFVLWEKVELKHNYSVLFLVKLWLKVAAGAGLEHFTICFIISKNTFTAYQIMFTEQEAPQWQSSNI